MWTPIGPSEIGTPCDRRLGYKLAGVPEETAGKILQHGPDTAILADNDDAVLPAFADGERTALACRQSGGPGPNHGDPFPGALNRGLRDNPALVERVLDELGLATGRTRKGGVHAQLSTSDTAMATLALRLGLGRVGTKTLGVRAPLFRLDLLVDQAVVPTHVNSPHRHAHASIPKIVT